MGNSPSISFVIQSLFRKNMTAAALPPLSRVIFALQKASQTLRRARRKQVGYVPEDGLVASANFPRLSVVEIGTLP